jgi:hypothetical protein
MNDYVFVCTSPVAGTDSGASPGDCAAGAGAYVAVAPPLVMTSSAFASLTEVTVWAFLAAFAIRLIVRAIWRP